MKSFLLVLCLITLFSFSPQSPEREQYNVFEYEMRLDRGEPSLVYYSNEKCYTAFIKIRRSRSKYSIEVDDFTYNFVILSVRHSSKHRNVYMAARTGGAQLYSIMEYYGDGKFFLTIKPIRFNSKYAIDEKGLVISKEEVCGIH